VTWSDIRVTVVETISGCGAYISRMPGSDKSIRIFKLSRVSERRKSQSIASRIEISRKCARPRTAEVLRPPWFMPKQSSIVVWVCLDRDFPVSQALRGRSSVPIDKLEKFGNIMRMMPMYAGSKPQEACEAHSDHLTPSLSTHSDSHRSSIIFSRPSVRAIWPHTHQSGVMQSFECALCCLTTDKASFFTLRTASGLIRSACRKNRAELTLLKISGRFGAS
jgi:hypothetical protein